MWLIDFFREDFSNVLGIYFDGDKIFLAHLAEKIETAEIEFAEQSPAQLAEKVAEICAERGWKNFKIGVALRDGVATTFQTEFSSVPEKEIAEAVKIWAIAHVGKEARYTSIKFDDEIWMEALNESIVEEYVAAFKKFSLNLCALTEIPQPPAEPLERAKLVAQIVRENTAPNFLAKQISAWSFKKIALTTVATASIVLAGFSAELAYEYFAAESALQAARANLDAQNNLQILKENFDAISAEMKKLNELSAAQNSNAKKFNALIQIGRLADGKVYLDKIRASGESLELEGVADTPDAVKNYLSRLKKSMSKVKLENSAANDGQINFLIRATF